MPPTDAKAVHRCSVTALGNGVGGAVVAEGVVGTATNGWPVAGAADERRATLVSSPVAGAQAWKPSPVTRTKPIAAGTHRRDMLERYNAIGWRAGFAGSSTG